MEHGAELIESDRHFQNISGLVHVKKPDNAACYCRES